MKKTFLILLALLLSITVYCQNNFRYPISVQSKQITGNTIDTLRNVAYKVLSDNINLSTVLVELSDTLKGPGNYVTPYQYHTTVGQTDILYLLKLMGSEFKAFPVNPMQGSAYLQIANNTAYGTAIYLPIRTLITGIHIAVGNSVTSYTADGTAFNGYALYSLNSSTGVITKVAQTTDGAGNFSGNSYEGKDNDFTSSITLDAGIYYGVIYYKSTAAPSPPAFVQTSAMYNNHPKMLSKGATPSIVYFGFLKTGLGTVQNTITLSTCTAAGQQIFMALY